MDIFKQKKYLIRTVIFFALLNMFLIGIFLWKDVFRNPPPPPPGSDMPHDVSSILEKELDLSVGQVNKIRKLRTSFFEKEKVVGETIRNERDSMNLVMFNKISDEAEVKNLARRIADNEYKMELLKFEQAQELKSICTPEQQEMFEKLVLEIRDYFRPNNPPPHK